VIGLIIGKRRETGIKRNKPRLSSGFRQLRRQAKKVDWAILDSNQCEGHGENGHQLENGAESGAVGARETLVDPGMERLAELWLMLSPDDQAALLAHAEHLAGLRNDANHSS
jgi:hypothetical protein